MQLLKITNLPIKYQMEIEPARLEAQPYKGPEQKISREQSHLNIRSHNIEVRLDATAMRESLNMRNNDAWAKNGASRGRQTVYQTMGEAVQFGNQMAEDGVSIAQIIRQKLMEQPTTYTTFLPSQGPEISWQPNEQSIQYDPGSLQIDWQLERNVMDYVPGKFSMSILQYPKVSIEYLGSPNYVPPSADPAYQERGA